MRLVEDKKNQTLSLYKSNCTQLVLVLHYDEHDWAVLYYGFATKSEIDNALAEAQKKYANGVV